MKTLGKVTGIVSNLVTVEVDGPVAENELCYITLGATKLMAEVIKVKGKNASVQVFESTRGLKNGDSVEFEGKMLEISLVPDCCQASMTDFRTTLPPWKAYSSREANTPHHWTIPSSGTSPLW